MSADKYAKFVLTEIEVVESKQLWFRERRRVEISQPNCMTSPTTSIVPKSPKEPTVPAVNLHTRASKKAHCTVQWKAQS